LRQARSSVVIAAPFIKVGALEHLLSCVDSSVRVHIFTRWRPEEVAAGVSDPLILKIALRRGASVRLINELHAKFFMVDDKVMLVGSANVTAPALGLSDRSNLELLTPVTPSPQELALFLAEMRFRGELATEKEMIRLLALAEKLPSAVSSDDPGEGETYRPDPRFQWMPRFRSPDRLYRLYLDADYLLGMPVTDEAVADICALGVPANLAEEKFDDHARKALRRSPLVVALNSYLSEPKRFGAITEWLADERPDLDHSARQSAIQTLIRWLLYFDATHYRLQTPHYTEILGYTP
jgi:hypothetical protein